MTGVKKHGTPETIRNAISIIQSTPKGQPVFPKVPQNMDSHRFRRDYANNVYWQYARKEQDVPKDERTTRTLISKDGVVSIEWFDRKAIYKVSDVLGHNRPGVSIENYMFAKTLADDQSIDRVFFIVDRTDLDKKSVDDFKTYDPTFDQEIIGWTGSLIKQIKERKLVVTTIFKIDKAVRTHKYAKDIEFLKGKNVVFIYDECHRSQIGSMRKDIDAFFNKPLSYGFTGTPIFKAEKDTPITADLFDSWPNSWRNWH